MAIGTCIKCDQQRELVLDCVCAACRDALDRQATPEWIRESQTYKIIDETCAKWTLRDGPSYRDASPERQRRIRLAGDEILLKLQSLSLFDEAIERGWWDPDPAIWYPDWPNDGPTARGAFRSPGTCIKCGELKELIFAGSVCGNCSYALDKQWASSHATGWVLREVRHYAGGQPSVQEFVYLDKTYDSVKTLYWASTEFLTSGFWRTDKPTGEEIARAESRGAVDWTDRSIRPSTRNEVAAYKKSHREWSIAEEADRIIAGICETLGIQMDKQEEPVGGSQRIEQAIEEVSAILSERGWLQELVRMRRKREGCLAIDAMDCHRLLEMVLENADSPCEASSESAVVKKGHDYRRGLSGVAGMSELKEQLIHDVIGPFRDPEPYRRYRVSLPNGILFYGPPGCGKTYIARALAEELGWFFQYCRPSDVASPYIHDTVTKIHEIFSSAIKTAPSIVFIDEFEAFVPARSELGGHQQFKAEEVNEFLANLEGCAERKVLVIAASNEPEKIDAAVRRSGRFDKLILIPPPDAEARRAMLEFHLSDRPVQESLDAARIARTLEGYSASDIKFLVDEAARIALKQRELISTTILSAALDRVPPSITVENMARYSAFRSRGT